MYLLMAFLRTMPVAQGYVTFSVWMTADVGPEAHCKEEVVS
jgi:hypothetical protein